MYRSYAPCTSPTVTMRVTPSHSHGLAASIAGSAATSVAASTANGNRKRRRFMIWTTKRPMLSRIVLRPRPDHGNIARFEDTHAEHITESRRTARAHQRDSHVGD